MHAMSLQEDLEAFRELALEQQYWLNEQGEPYDVQSVYQILDPLLDSVVQFRRISLSGTVWVPILDKKTGDFIDAEIATEPVEGISKGVYIRQEDEDLEGVMLTRAVIGYWACTGNVNKQDWYIIGTDRIMVFAPIESSQCSVPEDNMPDFETMMPDDDDVIAQEIDEAVLDTQPNFSKLSEIFASIPSDSTLQVNFYQNYLNHIFPTDGVTFALLANNFLEIDITDGEVKQSGQLAEYAGEIDGFKCITADDETVLCLELNSEEYGAEIITLIPVRALLNCQFTTSNKED